MENSSDQSTSGPTSPLLTEPGVCESLDTPSTSSEKAELENVNGLLSPNNGNRPSPSVDKRNGRAVEVTLPLSEERKHQDLSITELLQTAYVTSPSECGHSSNSPDGMKLTEAPQNQEAGNENNFHTFIHGQKTTPKTLKLRLIPFEKGRSHPSQMPFPPAWSDDEEEDSWTDIDPDVHNPPPLDAVPNKSCLEKNHDADKNGVHFSSKTNVKHYDPENASSTNAPKKENQGIFFTADIIPRPRKTPKPRMYFTYPDDLDEGENDDPTVRRVMRKDGLTWYIRGDTEADLRPQPVFGGHASCDRPLGHLMDGLRDNGGMPPRKRELDLILTFYVPCDDHDSDQESDCEPSGSDSYPTETLSTPHEHNEQAMSGQVRRRAFLRMLSKSFRRVVASLNSCWRNPYHDRM